MAARGGQTDLVEELIRAKADIECTEANGSTPLHGACWGIFSVQRAQFRSSELTIAFASAGLHAAAVRALLLAGANKGAKNKFKLTPRQELDMKKDSPKLRNEIAHILETVVSLPRPFPRGQRIASALPIVSETISACVISGSALAAFQFPPALSRLIVEYALPRHFVCECSACGFRLAGLRCVGFRPAEPQKKVHSFTLISAQLHFVLLPN